MGRETSKIELDKNGRYHGKTPREHIEACRMEIRRVRKRGELLGEELAFWYEYINKQLLEAYGKKTN